MSAVFDSSNVYVFMCINYNSLMGSDFDGFGVSDLIVIKGFYIDV